MAALGLHDDEVTAWESLAPDAAQDRLETAPPTAHAGPQQGLGVLRKGGPLHRRDREDNRARAPPRRPPLAPLRDPMVASDVGTASAQRRRAPHRHHRLALATRLTARREIPPRVGLPAAEPLVHETLLGAGIVARGDGCAALPGLDTERLDDVPVLSRLCPDPIAPSQGIGFVGRERFYHVSRSASTPSSVFTGAPSPPFKCRLFSYATLGSGE